MKSFVPTFTVAAVLRLVKLRALRLLDLQLWCWGRDVQYAEGNLLISNGFRRIRPPEHSAGSSAYHLRTAAGLELTLWGFGVHARRPDEAGLFLKRFGFSPRWTSASTDTTRHWHIQDWQRARAPRNDEEQRLILSRLHDLTAWIACYEETIAETTPPGWREHCIRDWHKEACVPASALAHAWAELAEQFTLNPTSQPQESSR